MLYPVQKVSMKRPYFGGRGALPVSLVVVHYTAGREQGDLEVLRGGTDRLVSVHYLVGRHDGFGIKALVPESKVAWHAGKSQWTDHNGVTRSGVNSFSIGIEMSNLGPPEEFTDFHYEAVAQLARDIMARHSRITIDRFVGHNQVSPGRKIDPGPLWNWDRFRTLATAEPKPLKIVILPDNTLVECNPKVEKGVTRVDLRSLCEALKIALPTGNMLDPLKPEVIPPGVTRVDLRALVESQGWDVLAHRLIPDNKIYLRRRDPSFNENENDS